jgi:tetratricopeptide (TPR) repeat protein
MNNGLTRRANSAAYVIVSILLVGALAAWLLSNPQNWFTRLFQARIANFDARVVVGPYPSEDDFAALQANGVGTDVSLLDPQLPYESGLLVREKALAAKYGLKFVDFPMESFFGTRVGRDYDQEARLAAAYVEHTKGRVYVHCYLGMHRVRAVEALLTKAGTQTATYLLNHGTRSADSRLLDEAQADYDAGRYAYALKAERGIGSPTIAARLLAAWSYYHLGRVADARSSFAGVVKTDQMQAGAFEGLGYCALRNGDLENAASLFLTAGRLAPRDGSAYTGLGLTRYRQGRLLDAREALSEAVSLNPSDADARAALAKVQ